MIKWMKMFVILCVWGWVSGVGAQEMYVSGITKITMRTGPGVEHKILAMLESGSRLEVLEYQSDWSLVQTENQKQGWVLTRFLTEDKPLMFQVEKLRKENKALANALEQIDTQNQVLAEKNDALADIEEKYRKLKQASADFMELNEKYQALVQLSKEQAQQISMLKENLNNEAMLWFLSGAGVFIVGLILGLSTRKKKRHSLL
ncbi:MAG: TIGR04211 family SH3 domain-containing protein [Desulfotignum balticum]|jgi:SH3 domain protein|uniref:TIGR04211 family SH3 domain-containing protein n=1 Tax=Desulfotignum balticum TaxID=115781 RepID=A0A931CX22_9BACT|nr:TIGR04211 family SH3 domain-containing protein [Desulfotignum balticum]